MSKDALSALLDGECTGAELDRLLEDMDREPELARQWSRMVLARETRAGTQLSTTRPCICADVMSQLDGQPANERVVDLAVHRASSPSAATLQRWRQVWKPAAGFALAASMGAAAVLLVQPSANVEGLDPLLFQDTRADAGTFPPLPTESVALETDEQHRRMLREYMLNHSQSIAGEGVNDMMGGTRFVVNSVVGGNPGDRGR